MTSPEWAGGQHQLSLRDEGQGRAAGRRCHFGDGLLRQQRTFVLRAGAVWLRSPAAMKRGTA
jgi:hypothetical protein